MEPGLQYSGEVGRVGMVEVGGLEACTQYLAMVRALGPGAATSSITTRSLLLLTGFIYYFYF